MTLGDFKQRVLRLIEEIDVDKKELTDDPDISNKFNTVTNQLMFELFRYKGIIVKDTVNVTENEEFILNEEYSDFYQLKIIKGVEYNIDDNIVTFLEDGKATIYYYKYPKSITKDTEDTYKFELATEVLECMVYGVAADILKSDVSSNYGQVYSQRYSELKQMLDPRQSQGSVYIDGGI